MTTQIAPPVQLRAIEPADGDEVARIVYEAFAGVHDHHRFEREDALGVPAFSPTVAIRDGRLVAYAATLTFFPAAHAVAETEDDMAALIAATLTATDQPASFLLPTRQAEPFRWCLAQGLRVVKPMTYMTVGRYETPAGSWIPSVLY